MLCQKANTKTFTSLIDPDIRNDVRKEQDPSGYKAVPESKNVDERLCFNSNYFNLDIY